MVARLVAGLLLLNLAVIGLAVLSMVESRQQFESHAAEVTRNMVQLIEHDVVSTVRMIDLAVLSTAAEYHSRLASGELTAGSVRAFLAQQLAWHPRLSGLHIVDERGFVTHGPEVSRTGQINVADREYFDTLRRDPDAGLVISRPVQGRITGQWVVNFARALRHPDGRFAGSVIGTVPLTQFTHAYGTLSVGPNGVFTFFDDQLRILIRQPEPQGPDTSIGMPFGSRELHERMRRGDTNGTYRVLSTVDGLERVYSFRKIANTPFNIVIGMATLDYLTQWRQEALKTAGLVLVFVLVTLFLTRFVYRFWKGQEASMRALRQANRRLAEEKSLNQTIVQSSPFAIYTRDRHGIVTGWNPAAEHLFGWRAEEIVGQPLPSVPSGKEHENQELCARVLGGERIIQLEVQRQKRDGTVFDLSTTLAPLHDEAGEVSGYLSIAADITERKAAEKQIEFLAYRDVLTGLPNRLLLQDRLQQATVHADRAHHKVALLFLDLDNFKTINDSLGHAVGDALLKEIAARLGVCVRDTDTISRQGGDEFLIVLPDLRGMDEVTPVLLEIRENLQMPFVVEGHELITSVSVGVAIYPDDGHDFDTLLKKADTAMYRAKDGGRSNYRFFDEQMNVEAVEHLQIKNGLRRALAQGEFELHYQPQIDLASGAVIGAEALLRWHHPEHGTIGPDRFIPVAEDGGMIVSIGEWVMHEACRQAMAWRRAGLPPLTMAVNLSAVQFRRGDVEQTVIQALQASGFDPHRLELELTESILIQDTENVLASVRRLKQLGVKLSIDDFGTGYSSLSYLKRLDVDKFKIDQSFIRDVASDPDDAAITRAIIQMASSLNLRILAEGVENAETLAQLRRFACDEAQGFYFARPMTAQAFAEFLGRQSHRLPAGEGERTI